MMTQQWTVMCDSEPAADGSWCCWYDQVSGTKRVAKAEFIRAGWRLKKGKWMCPNCVAEGCNKRC